MQMFKFLGIGLILICFGAFSQNAVKFSHETGVYDNLFELKLKCKRCYEIRYTLDGSEPTASSELYLKPLAVDDGYSRPDVLSHIQTGMRKPNPAMDRFKGWIIRAACFKDGAKTSQTYTKSYFLIQDYKKQYGEFNIVSIVTDSLNLFSKDSGIFAFKGEVGDVGKGNFMERGRAWERRAFFSYIPANGKATTELDVGIRIHGSTTRKNAQKSLRLYAREEYGNPFIVGKFFGESRDQLYEKLILRNSMGGWHKTIFKDELTSYLCKGLNVELPASNLTLLFINGEYWGLQILKDYYCSENLALKNEVLEDSINLLQHGTGYSTSSEAGLMHGSAESHKRLYEILKSHDLQDSTSFELVKNYLDVSSFIDYYCAHLFFGNIDYVGNNNRLWSIGSNGKWRQILYDFDGCWAELEVNPFTPLLRQESTERYPTWATFMFQSLWTNPHFKKQFVNRFICLMKSDFSKDNLFAGLEKYIDLYRPVVKEHIGRWGVPGSVSQWEHKVSFLFTFANNRHDVLLKSLNEVLEKDFDLDDYSCP